MDYSYSPSSNRNLNNLIIATLPNIINYISHSNSLNKLITNSSFDSIAYKIISFEDYLQRLIKLFDVESNTVIYSFVLIDFISQRGLFISMKNIHKLFMISLYVSAKIMEDIIFSEKVLSEICGLPQEEIALLESEFLRMLNYDLIIPINIFNTYMKIFDI